MLGGQGGVPGDPSSGSNPPKQDWLSGHCPPHLKYPDAQCPGAGWSPNASVWWDSALHFKYKKVEEEVKVKGKRTPEVPAPGLRN